ncbi:hypothetical protein LCGC14_1584900 [marine sediment metagenome]|uniref:Uncharacterized protein n=1 Tax=marine sediment metagenome TaxID=412755 RepID=A0A0F9IFY7_9ZZZZ
MSTSSFKQAKASHKSGQHVTAAGLWRMRDSYHSAFDSLDASLNGGFEIVKFGTVACQVRVYGELKWARPVRCDHNAGRFNVN